MKTIIKLLTILFILSSLNGNIFSQTLSQAKDTTEPWHMKDYNSTGIMGISLKQAMNYAEEKGRKQKKIIVAVIDSGTDTAHYDLKNKLWTNPNEIPGNGIDDDNNGYIDDIHGWNFIGNPNGKNVDGDRLEITRIYARLGTEFEGMKKSDIAEDRIDSFNIWLEAKEKYNKDFNDYLSYKKNTEFNIKLLTKANQILTNHFETDNFSAEDVENITTDSELLGEAQSIYMFFYNYDMSIKSMKDYLEDVEKTLSTKYKIDYEPRKIVGDNVFDINDSIYGNNDIEAASPGHGTHCAGIIAADWTNNEGTHGIAQNVEIMTIRVVPGGDERDKDVALAIRYAVKMGANVINCSFGKDFSPNKKFVDDALKYADKHNVLIVKAAGNDALNIDEDIHYPTKFYSDSEDFMKNIITVGASTQYNNKELIASFSNYGPITCDLFAPGYDILSTYPKSKIKELSGTSMASPVVAGVAALIWSYYPELSASQLKQIILEGTYKPKKLKVRHPDTKLFSKKFKKYSTSGGIVNAYLSMKLAEKLINQ